MMFSPKIHTEKELKVTHLNALLLQQQQSIVDFAFSKTQKKQHHKLQQKQAKQREQHDNKIYVLQFDGDIQASQVENLKEEITAILSVARAGKDKIILKLESPGGVVHGYGLAAAQLSRLREAGFDLTVCVDKVAASGGYLMACVAQNVVCAPFAIVGSIGVVAQMPNFNKLLKHLKIDYDVYTAGEYKRTVTVFGENSDAGKLKFEEELKQTHDLFQHYVSKYRPQLNIATVATGEHWYGQDALKLKLVDQIQTSDAYLLSLMATHDIYVVQLESKPSLAEKLGLDKVAQLAVTQGFKLAQNSLTGIENRVQPLLKHWF